MTSSAQICKLARNPAAQHPKIIKHRTTSLRPIGKNVIISQGYEKEPRLRGVYMCREEQLHTTPPQLSQTYNKKASYMRTHHHSAPP